MVRFLSRVDTQVALESLKVPEAGPTDFAGIGLLPSVDEHVGTEVGHLKRSTGIKTLPLGWATDLPAATGHSQSPRGPLTPGLAQLTCTNLAPQVSHL